MVLPLLLACAPLRGPADTLADPVDTAGAGADTGAGVGWDTPELRWHDGDLHFSQQADLDRFCDAHNAVRGNLTVDVGAAGDTITELDGIGCLREVTGDLEVYADALPEGGAPPPPHVTGDLELNALEQIGGDLRLRTLANLTFLQELIALRTVGGDIVIEDCPDLQYGTLYSLEALGGTLALKDLQKLLVFRAPSLAAAGGISLGAARDSETMFFFTELGVENLSEVSGDIEVFGARNLGRLSAPALSTIGGRLHIEAACSLAPAMPALTALGSLHISGNCGLLDLSGLSSLSSLTSTDKNGYSIWLDGNDLLSTDAIDSFVGGLDSVAGDVHAERGDGCSTLFNDYADGYCP